MNALNVKNIVLKSALSDNTFNFLHLNPGSLKPHVDELRTFVNDVSLHAIAVSETWFSGKVNDGLVSINNFSLFRHDRVNRRGGGVAVYLRNGLKTRIIRKSRANTKIEFLILEIDNRAGDKIAFAVVYNPPSNSLIDPLKNALTDLATNYSHCIVVGDLNINMLLSTARTKRFKKILISINLTFLSNEPTNFVQDKIPSQIDLALFKNVGLVKTFSQLSQGSYTSHAFSLAPTQSI